MKNHSISTPSLLAFCAILLLFFVMSSAVSGAPDAERAHVLRIGLVDTQPDPEHPSLNGVQIHYREFRKPGRPSGHKALPSGDEHGTVSAAAILAGIRSMTPNGDFELMVANPFIGSEEIRRSPDIRDSYRLALSHQHLIESYRWFAEQGVRVVAITFVGKDTDAMRHSSLEAARLGLILVASTGNRRWSARQYPAAYPWTIAVSGVERGLGYSRRSGWGPHVDVSALNAMGWLGFPGAEGTSFAAAYTAGVVSHLAERSDQPSRESLLALLDGIAVDRGPVGWDRRYGRGVLVSGSDQKSD